MVTLLAAQSATNYTASDCFLPRKFGQDLFLIPSTSGWRAIDTLVVVCRARAARIRCRLDRSQSSCARTSKTRLIILTSRLCLCTFINCCKRAAQVEFKVSAGMGTRSGGGGRGLKPRSRGTTAGEISCRRGPRKDNLGGRRGRTRGRTGGRPPGRGLHARRVHTRAGEERSALSALRTRPAMAKD